MAWLGCALWLKDLGCTTEEAAEAAGPFLEALSGLPAEEGEQS
jgi:hypothetical protein